MIGKEINQESSLVLVYTITIVGAIITFISASLMGLQNPTGIAFISYGFFSIILLSIWALFFMRDNQRGKFYSKPTNRNNEIAFKVRIGNGHLETRYVELEGRKIKIINHNLTYIDLSSLQQHPEIILLDLSLNRLIDIDLTPLEACKNLSILNLTSNELEQINLQFILKTPELKYLDLSNNRLTEISLEPLSVCRNLDTLDLGGNFFGKIDLKALESCTQMECLTIDGTNIHSLDLSPLESCEKLEHLILNDNRIRALDITPLMNCKKLDLLDIDHIDLVVSENMESHDYPIGVLHHIDRIKHT